MDLSEPNNSLQLWEIVTAFVLPLIIAFIQQPTWSPRLRSLVMFATSAVVVIGQLLFSGELDNWSDPAVSVLTVVVMTIAFYKGVWKPTGVAPSIEAATSVTQ